MDEEKDWGEEDEKEEEDERGLIRTRTEEDQED